MITGRMGKISVFCSYAHEDDSYRRALQEHVAPLRAAKIIDDWYDDRIQPSARWSAEIGTALERARLVLFIVTPDLLASRYVREVELPKSLELERQGRCQIVPIVARATEWTDSPLAEFQALPRNAQPIEAYGSPNDAYGEVTEGLREVCKRIVDWENAYKRGRVGDWTHVEQTMTLPTGQSVTMQGTSELVKKSANEATVLLEIAGGTESMTKTITIDLTQPLEDRMGDLMKQVGQALPANVEVRVGPSRFDEEVLQIGGERYETIKVSRQLTIAQRGWEESGVVSNWRCIDVPLDGIVKGTCDLSVMRQNQVLLGYGHGDAKARKPRVVEATPAGPIVGPGRWRIELNVLGVGTAFDLLLQPNGMLVGKQGLMGIVADLQGRWGFEPQNNVLTLQIAVMMMGMPASQDVIVMQIVDGQGSTLRGIDNLGREFHLQRIG